MSYRAIECHGESAFSSDDLGWVLTCFDRQQLPNLKELSIDYPSITSLQAKLLATAVTYTQLNKLSISFDVFPEEEVNGFLRGALNNQEIKTKFFLLGNKLFYAAQDIPEEDFKELMALVQEIPSEAAPNELHLHTQQLGEPQLSELAKILKSANLKLLQLNIAKITPESMLILLQAIASNNTVSELSIKLDNIRFENKEAIAQFIAQQQRAQVELQEEEQRAKELYESEQKWVDDLSKLLDGTHISNALNHPQVTELLDDAKADFGELSRSAKDLFSQGRQLISSFMPSWPAQPPASDGALPEEDEEKRRAAQVATLK